MEPSTSIKHTVYNIYNTRFSNNSWMASSTTVVAIAVLAISWISQVCPPFHYDKTFLNPIETKTLTVSIHLLVWIVLHETVLTAPYFSQLNSKSNYGRAPLHLFVLVINNCCTFRVLAANVLAAAAAACISAGSLTSSLLPCTQRTLLNLTHTHSLAVSKTWQQRTSSMIWHNSSPMCCTILPWGWRVLPQIKI